MQAPFLNAWLAEARPAVPVLLETNGMLPEALAEVIDRVDIVSMDLKLPSNTGEPEFWRQHADFARIARRRRWYAKILVDGSSAVDEFDRAVGIIAEVDPSIPVFIQPIVDESGQLRADEHLLVRLHARARQSLADVRVTPQLHKLMGLR